MKLNLNIKAKIIGLALAVGIGISVITVIVLFIVGESISTTIEESVFQTSKRNVESIVGNIYKSCEVTNEVLDKILVYKLRDVKNLIRNKGGVILSGETVTWNAVNQFNKESKAVVIPKLLIGSSWLGINRSFSSYQMIVDDMSEQNYTVTLFQRMNEKGDMLRVATNVKLEDGERAIGTYIPVVNPDGNPNPVLSEILKGESYHGNAFVVNDYYQTVYEPIKNSSGTIIGMVYVGVSLKAADKLKQSVLSTLVGKTGYVYVLGGSGARKGYYIISKEGKRDGENVWDVKDAKGELVIQKIINQATSQMEGTISFIKYPWINPGDDKPKEKIVALAYYKPFDWVIGAGTNLEEIEESSVIVHEGFNQIYFYLIIAVIVSLVLVFLISVSLSEKISHPITKSAHIMLELSKGNIKNVKNELTELESWYYSNKRN